MSDEQTPQVPQAPSVEEIKARNRRNMWLGLALFGFVVLVLVVTMVRLYSATGVAERM
jgi:hypothetical protein